MDTARYAHEREHYLRYLASTCIYHVWTTNFRQIIHRAIAVSLFYHEYNGRLITTFKIQAEQFMFKMIFLAAIIEWISSRRLIYSKILVLQFQPLPSHGQKTKVCLPQIAQILVCHRPSGFRA